MTTKSLLILTLATIFLSQNINGQKIESNVDKGNLSTVWMQLDLLSGSVRRTLIQKDIPYARYYNSRFVYFLSTF